MTEHELTARIIHYRKQMGLTQKEFATRCDLTQSTISTIENNHYYPSMYSFFEICRGLNISPAQFLATTTAQELCHTEDERKLLELWNNLNIQKQKFVLTLLEELKNMENY